MNKDKKELILTLYKQGLSCGKIDKQLNITSSHYYVKKAGINRSLLEANRQYSFDEEYFKTINTEAKAYWLGFIMADGCVHISEKFRKRALQIAISYKDIELLHQFKKDLGYNGNICVYKSQRKLGLKTYCCISISNKILTDHLINQGVVPTKTHILEYPTIKKDLEHHFIRGYFDGDGSVSKQGDKVSFSGTYNFLSEVQKVFINNLSLSPVKIYSDKSVFRYCKSGRKQTSKIFEWLYKDATIYLKRKYNRFTSAQVKQG